MVITFGQVAAALEVLGFDPGTVLEISIPNTWREPVRATVVLVDEDTGRPYLVGPDGEPSVAEVRVRLARAEPTDDPSE